MLFKVFKPLFVLCLLLQSNNEINGTWKLVSYDAIEKIRLSPAYVYADDNAREVIEKQFELTLSEGEYKFSDTELNYTDLEGTNIIYRRANYHIVNDTLLIEEIDRDFKRKAYIKYLSADSLVLSPIIDDKISDSKLIFSKK